MVIGKVEKMKRVKLIAPILPSGEHQYPPYLSMLLRRDDGQIIGSAAMLIVGAILAK